MVFIFVGSFVSGATYYVDDDAIDNSGDGLTPTTSKHNIQAALSLANDLGGDTIIILDGIYDELEDRITQSYLPSSANTYTTIKAQNRWGVEIKQSLDCSNDWSSRNYIHLDGLKFTNLAYHRFNGANWKITNCAFYGTLGMGNNGCFQNGFNCEDILIEDTHVWGPGGVDSMRYKVLVYNNKRVILRRVVARHDGGYTTTLSNPSAVFIIYSSQSVRLQNTIAIDSPGQVNDRWNAGYYTADHQYSGQLSWTDVKWEGSIAMNIKDTISFRIDNTHDSDGVDTVYDNCVALAGSGGSTFAAYCSSNCINSDSVIYNQCNAIDSGTTVTNDAFWESRYNSTVQYSIMLNQSGDAISYIDYTNYNNAYGCNNNNPGTNGFTIDPKQSGLLYPVRIESGSSLETVGNGQRVGANIIYRWGGTGIMWGEPGFNEIST
ncbi:hypothetical protein KAJ38_03325, partial [Candidatus Pacearchaeota archaeon]|nr:hypothetical protein [Candidatus Pacearchaeota archaeon]